VHLVGGQMVCTSSRRFDRAGMRRCVPPPNVPPPTLDPSHYVWFDDATAPGATLNVPWTWDTAQKAAGTQSVLLAEPMAQKELNSPALRP
jgi:hypothetical protein